MAKKKVIAPVEEVVEVSKVQPEAPVVKKESPKEAPDKIEVNFKEAFKAITFGNKEWFVYDNQGRRLTGGISEDEAVRLVRGFGVK